ncbi:Enoki mushroom [Strongyloides ratti]|uniref:histone acetyltransferase n=1 Tax=Strongyloides ratti TaxID=34506 RepID=A0A090L971_STRRB|nr:Enoki mushroom [Strongyloides ratti]CEF66326.1 Enoki mushroom [Strongyloides ratti]
MPVYKTKKNSVCSLKSITCKKNAKVEVENEKIENKYYSFSNKIFNDISASDMMKELIKLEEKERQEYSSIEEHEPPYIFVDGQNIKAINIGPHMDVIVMAKQLYLCELCFRMFRDEALFNDHTRNIHVGKNNRPPGQIMYNCKQKNFSIWKMNKEEQRICEDLCLLGTYFLKSKTSVYTTYQFDLYTAYFKKPCGKYCFAGFYSKMPEQPEHVLSCIVVLPTMQGKGVGTMLVDFAYLMDRYPTPNYGSPEKPLSEQGKILFMKYWKAKIADYVLREFYGPNATNDTQITLKKLITPISEYTGINKKDLAEAIKELGEDIKRKSGFQSLRVKIINQLKELLRKYRNGHFYCPYSHISNNTDYDITNDKKRKRGLLDEIQLPCKRSKSKSPVKNCKSVVSSSSYRGVSPNSVLSSSSASLNDNDEVGIAYDNKYGSNDYEMYDMSENRSSSSTPKQKFDSPKTSYNNIEIINMGGEPDEDDLEDNTTLTDMPPQLCQSMERENVEIMNSKELSLNNQQSSDSPPPQLTPMMLNIETVNDSIEYVGPPPLLSTENIEVESQNSKACIYDQNNSINCGEQLPPDNRMITNSLSQQPQQEMLPQNTVPEDISMNNLNISTPTMIPNHIENNQNDMQPYSNISNPSQSYTTTSNILKNMEQITKISPVAPSKALEMNPMSMATESHQSSSKSNRKDSDSKNKIIHHHDTGRHSQPMNLPLRNIPQYSQSVMSNHEPMTPTMSMNINLAQQYDMNQINSISAMNNPFVYNNPSTTPYPDHVNNIRATNMNSHYNPYLSQYPGGTYNQSGSMNPCLYNNSGYPSMINSTSQMPQQNMSMLTNQTGMGMNYPYFNNYPSNIPMCSNVGYPGSMYSMNIYPNFFNPMGNNMNRSQMPTFPGQMNQGNQR